MNVFFFSDNSMHKIFLNYGKYNFIQQIPQILYSTIISQLLEVFTCYLSLTDKHINEIKNLTGYNKKQEIVNILHKIKINLFFRFYFYNFRILLVYCFSFLCSLSKNSNYIFERFIIQFFIKSFISFLFIFISFCFTKIIF